MKLSPKFTLKVIAVVITTTAFASFILEEAVQTAGFGLWIAKDDPDVLGWYLPSYAKLVEVVRTVFWVMLVINPATGWVYVLFIEAETLKLQAYQSLLGG